MVFQQPPSFHRPSGTLRAARIPFCTTLNHTLPSPAPNIGLDAHHFRATMSPALSNRRISTGGKSAKGWVAEWSIAHAWKACLPKGNGGSNPPPSAALIVRTLRLQSGRAKGSHYRH